MSWKPPPSLFTPGESSGQQQSKDTTTTTTTASYSLSAQKQDPAAAAAAAGAQSATKNLLSPSKDGKMSVSKRKNWAAAPTFVVGDSDDTTMETSPATKTPGDLPLKHPGPNNINQTVPDPSPLPEKASKRETSPAQRSPNISPGPPGTRKPATPKKKVGWNQTLFVVDQDGGSASIEESARGAADEDSPPAYDQDGDEYVIQVPSRAALGFDKAFFSKKEFLVCDQTMLRTRLEWSQLLVSKAFKPYRQMICAVDDDLPNPKDLEEMEEAASSNEDYLDGKKELIKIRDEMLDDPDLNEKLIAAFFEGYKLFQMKVNSLQSQLEGMKSMQKVSLQPSFSGTRILKSERFTPNAFLPSVPQRNPSMPAAIAPFQTLPVWNEEDKEGSSASTGARPSVASPEIPSSTTTNLNAPISRASDDSRDENGGRQNAPPTTTKRDSRAQAAPRKRGFGGPSRSIRQMSIQRIREATSGNEDISKLLAELEEAERRQKKLEKQLAQAGVVIAEDIPYDVAKEKVSSIARRMAEIGGSDVGDKKLQEEYYLLEREMEKYTTALQMTDEWVAEQEEMEQQWEESVTPGNEEAIKKLRRHMPVDVRNWSEAMLSSEPTPNGKYLPKNIAKKFKRTNVLQLLRIDPEDIVPMHAATLENMRVTGLTLTERRAMYHHLKDIGPRWRAMQGDKMTERKWSWFSMMKSNFKENVDSWQRHVDQYGPPGDHPYATRENPGSGCPLIGKQCPLRADQIIDYDGDYGFPEGQEYFKSDVKKSEVDNVSKAKQEAQDVMKQKKSEERSTALKQHYKGKILQFSLANGSCELMDEAMDNMEDIQEKWIKERLSSSEAPTDDSRKREMAGFNEALNILKLSILQFAERSGMQLTGKRDANADQPDIRSVIELSLCEEVIETASDFFEGIEERMVEMRLKDGRMKVTIEQLKTLLEELQERNRHTIESLCQERPPRSRELKSRSAIVIRVKKALSNEEKAKAVNADTPRGPTADAPDQGLGGRGDLLSALKGRGGRGGGGRGDLLSGLQGRGRGNGGGRGGLMAAIAGRGNS